MEHLVTKLESYLLSLIKQTFSPRQREAGVRMIRTRPVTSLRPGDKDYDWESRPIDMVASLRGNTGETQLRGNPGETQLRGDTGETQFRRDPGETQLRRRPAHTATVEDTDSEHSSTEELHIDIAVRDKRYVKRRGSQEASETYEEDDISVTRTKRTVRRRRRWRPVMINDELIFGMDVIL